jgi:hypothetical protein
MRIRLTLIAAGLIFAAAAPCAMEADFTAVAEMDWEAGRALVSVSRALDPSIPSLQKAENDAETAIDAGFTALLLQSLSPIVLDSSRTIGSLAAADPGFFSRLQSLARNAQKDTLVLSADFKKATAGYAFPLFTEKGIASPLFPAKDAPILRRPGFVATRAFTGLVVYAADPLPAVGGAEKQRAVPAVFPRFFDEEMNVVFDKGMCRLAALGKWGMVGYADSADESAIRARCGETPLIVAARAVFGVNHADLVIPTRAVLQILALEANIEILKEGKVLVIYPALR